MSITIDTDISLKSRLNTNQVLRERMSLAILQIDKRFSQLRPRHPQGGPDGGRDIQGIFEEKQIMFGAVGFLNDANDSDENIKKIKDKFLLDLDSAIKNRPSVFIFLTNVRLTIGVKDGLIKVANDKGIIECEIFDRELIRSMLDSVDGFAIRFQYLGIPLTEAEQTTFFNKWGKDIQEVITDGLTNVERKMDRLLFLQESHNALIDLNIILELDKTYTASDLNHFRLFCSIFLPKNNDNNDIIQFGATDINPLRVGSGVSEAVPPEKGLACGILNYQWINALTETSHDNNIPQEKRTSQGTHVGLKKTNYFTISYSSMPLLTETKLKVKDFDNSYWSLKLNESLSEKIKSISIYINDYKHAYANQNEFTINKEDYSFEDAIPFSNEELADKWVRLMPKNQSIFELNFAAVTPKRSYLPKDLAFTKEEQSFKPDSELNWKV